MFYSPKSMLDVLANKFDVLLSDLANPCQFQLHWGWAYFKNVSS